MAERSTGEATSVETGVLGAHVNGPLVYTLEYIPHPLHRYIHYSGNINGRSSSTVHYTHTVQLDSGGEGDTHTQGQADMAVQHL